MTREEAIKELRGFIGHLTEGCQEAIKVLFPELKESEDERIIEQIKFAVMQMPSDREDTKIECLTWLEKQKKQKPVEWKPQPESLEALMYAIEGKWEMIKPTSYLSRRLEDLYEGLVNTYHVDESLVTGLHKAASEEDIEALKELKRKIDASMEKPVEKHTEWSEENENKLNHILEIVHIASGREASVDEKEELESFLKSLKPQPKQD